MVMVLNYIVFALFSFPWPGAALQEEKIYTVSEVSVKPVPIDGLETFRKRWSRSVVYPEAAIKENVQGMVFIEFIVDKDGSVKEAAVRSGIGYGCDEAALSGFVKISENAWSPGQRLSSPVKVKMVLPFYFKIIKN